MVRGLYTASNSLIVNQSKMDTIANNLANINTTGFKKDGITYESFSDVLALRTAETDTDITQPIGKMALGVRIGQVYTNFKQGSINMTNSPLNIAIDGSGMLAVGSYDDDGTLKIHYTRDGSLTLSQDGTLMTKDGYYILDQNNEKIILQDSEVRITEKGELFVNDTLNQVLNLIDFENPESLRKVGDNLYTVTDETEPKAFQSKVLQGFLEASNVNSIKEMVDMISVMRNYESGQKVIQTMDETLNKAVNEIAR